MKEKVTGFKILTEDYRSPIQGGDPILARIPKKLPKVELDKNEQNDCGIGWNFCDSIRKCAGITKLVGNTGIHRILAVESGGDIIRSNSKIRSNKLTIKRQANKQELMEFITELHKDYKIDNKQADEELYKWLTVERYPTDKEVIEECLRKTLVDSFKDFNVVHLSNNNNNYHYYNNNYYNYYNNNYYYCNNNNYYYYYYNNDYYYNYYYNNDYYNYYYIIETIFTAIKGIKEELKIKQNLRRAYSYGMRRLYFGNNIIAYRTVDDI